MVLRQVILMIATKIVLATTLGLS